jgi:hypothetical protein
MADAAQGELLPSADDGAPLAALNHARFAAHHYASDAVQFLYATMKDAEEDTDRRIMAAAELLAFAKVP